MPSTPEPPDDSDDPFAVAEAAHVAASRETVQVGRPTEPVERTRPSRPSRDDSRDTVRVDDRMLGGRETVKLPTQRRPGERAQDRGRRAPLPVAAAFATLWAALLTWIPVSAVIGLGRTTEGQGGLGGAAHAGLAGWLLGHGVPVGTSLGPLSLPPLLLTLLAVWRLNRAGLHVTRAIGARRSGSIGASLTVAFTVGLAYSLLGSLAALAIDAPHTEVSPGRAALTFFGFGFGGSLLGASRGTGAHVTIARRLPRALRHGIRTGLVAALFLLAAGGAVAGLAVAVNGGRAADMISVYHTGVAGQAGLVLVSLAYGANASIWSACYLLGPGFALGTGSTIQLTNVTVGSLPSLPLLAGVPNGPLGGIGVILLALPALAGITAGWLLTTRLSRAREASAASAPPRKDAAGKPRRDNEGPRWSLVLGSGLLAGPVAGIVMGGLAELSAGSVAAGRMADIGPDPWAVALVATLVIGISAAIGAAAGRVFGAKK